MPLNYYKILNADPADSRAEIRIAFLNRALTCHPQRGGSHEQMQQIVEAWNVLSDPGRRATYDAAKESVDPVAVAAAARITTAAAQDAANYSQSWSEFAKQNFSISDAWYLPRDYQGRRFILRGGLIGGLLAIGAAALAILVVKAFSIFDNSQLPQVALLVKLVIIPSAAAGAWAGWRMHLSREASTNSLSVKVSVAPGDSRSLPDSIVCPKCGRGLRAPIETRGQMVQCSSCKAAFTNRFHPFGSPSVVSNQLRAVLILHLILVLALVLVPWSALLPPDLKSWRQAQATQQADLMQTSQLAFTGMLLFIFNFLAHIVSLGGLFFSKRWGLWLFCITIAVLISMALVDGPSVSPGLEEFASALLCMTAGAISVFGLCTVALGKGAEGA